MLHRIDHYNIIEELGKGGMGIVYKAEDTRLQRLVALKLLSKDSSSDPKVRDRFRKEAHLASSLQHQHICTIHEIDETADGELFISMDYYEGETLQQKLSKGIPSLDIILDYAIQITKGLTAAHKKGVIHRDIKPSNIIINQDGVVKILDFGLAKLSGHDSTQTGKALGSIYYISPEQAQGKRVDHLTDIWSLGVVLYEMVTGVLPFSQEFEAAVIYSILDKSAVPPTEINEELPEELETLIYRCLRKNREERYQSMEELKLELIRVREKLKQENQSADIPQIKKRQAERRLVTMLVTEISTFHELMITLKDESHTLLPRCFDLMDTTARQYGGTITEKTDRGFTILFGIAEKGENAPVQAVNAGIALQQGMDQLNASMNLELPVILKTGINTGTVIIKLSNINEREEYAVIGESAAFAHQLKELSTEGRILAGPQTCKHTNQLFDFIPAKSFETAGSDKPSEAFELRSNKIKDIRKTIRFDPLVRSEMVGREKEMDTLQYYLMKLVQGEGFIVNIIGEAGIGKSRLIAEFRKKEEVGRVNMLEGRGLASGENLSFHPLIELTRSLVGIKETDDDAEALHKLEVSVQHICSSEASEVFPFIATFMGMKLTGTHAERLKGLEGEGLEKLILKNLRTLLMMASDRKPLILLMEDLHWADQSSIRLLRSLYKLAETHPILFINVFRPDYKDSSEKLLMAVKDRYEKYHTEILLRSLDDHHSELLIKNLLKTKAIPSKIQTLIKGHAEGNPLFLEEVIRNMIDDGIIAMKEGQVRVSERIKAVVIPETIHEVLMARIDKLDEEARALLKIASVIGRHFYRKVLLEVADGEFEVDSLLERLFRIQLIRESRRKEEVEYLFKHALIQHTAYDTILRSQRIELHFKVAQAIEKVFGERLHDFYGVLAYHYSQGGDPERAEDFLIRAGEQAFRSSASTEALHYFREALSVYLEKQGQNADPEKVASLNKYIGYAHFNTGHFIETAQYLEKVLDYHSIKIPENPILLIAKVLKGLAIFLFRIYFPSRLARRIPTEWDIEIKDLILKKASALTITESMKFAIEMMVHLPRLTRFRFKDLESIEMIAAIFSLGGISLSISKRILNYCHKQLDHDNPRSLVRLQTMRIFQELVAGEWKEATYDEEIVNKACQIGDLYNSVTYLGMQIHVYLERGDRFAERIHQKLAEVSEIYDYEYGRLAKYSHGSLVLLKTRQFEKTVSLAEEGVEFMKNTLGNKPGTLMIYSMKIRAQIMLGDLHAAEETLSEAKDFSRSEKLVPYFHSYFLTANLLFGIRQLEEAILKGDGQKQSILKKQIMKTGKKALSVSQKVAYEKVETYRILGIYYWLIKRQGRAMKWWTRALTKADKLGAKIELASTLEEVARRLMEPGSRYKEFNGEGAASLLLRAKNLFKEMDITIK